ncbi:hypothetical protein CIW48_13915 [Methylobacterium sp. P1-11]|uniref:hypothetical protein n=1 Tax=Methylobacterium sp. P1-11 TaxID=2024616 RepID=UPI0011EFC91C|nr:hypothetical protein [Methylobacterium sp. P1-11]KAA0123207.1 hypothetical protein CIW48_13915 [Methylobacterium sp. P1-11]
MSLAFVALELLDIKAGFRPDQPRGCDGRWCGEGGSLTVVRKDRTGDPRVDAQTDDILDVLKDVVESTEPGEGVLYGIQIHTKLAARLRELDLPGIGRHGVEQSFVAGDIVRHGLSGSIRTDVLLRDGRTSAAPIRAIWDIKTGEKGLSPRRIRALRAGAGVDDSVPVIEIHLLRGISVKSRISVAVRTGVVVA